MSNVVISILYIDKDMNAVEYFRQALRRAGLVVDLQTAQDDKTFESSLQKHVPDLVALRIAPSLPQLNTVRKRLDQFDSSLGLVALIDKEGTPPGAKLLAHGASAIALIADVDYLIPIIQHELLLRHTAQERERLAERVNELSHRSSGLLEDANEPIAYIQDGVHVYANPAYLQLFSINSLEELQSFTLLGLIKKNQHTGFKRDLRKVSQSKKPIEFKLVGINPLTNDEFPFEFSMQASQYEGQDCLQLTVAVETADMSELQAAQDALTKTQLQLSEVKSKLITAEAKAAEAHAAVAAAPAPADSGLDSRLALIKQIKDNPPRSAWLVLLVFEDLPSLRRRYGIEAHDLWRLSTFSALKQTLPANATMVEYSDQSILILLSGYDVQQTDSMTNALKMLVINHDVEFDGQHLISGCRGQFASLTGGGQAVEDVLKRLESQTELFTRNNLSLTDAEDKEDLELRAAAAVDEPYEILAEALREDRIKILFAPIAAFTESDVEHYKIDFQISEKSGAALRWNTRLIHQRNHPALGQLDRWTIHQALQGLIRSLPSSPNPKVLFISLSINALLEPGLAEWVKQVLEQSKLPPQYLVFGIPDSALRMHLAQASALCEALTALGTSILLDDFDATDLESAEMIKPSYAMLAERVVTRLSRTRDNALKEQAKKIIHGLQAKQMKVIAEAVDAPSQMAMVWEFNLNFAMGDMIGEARNMMDFDFKSFMV